MGKLDILVQKLREELENGRYPVGTRFPSEYELAERYGVNKGTANKAVTVLVGNGLLERGKRGEGTRVLVSSLFPRGQITFLAPIAHPYWAQIQDGIQNAALQRGYLVIQLAPRPEMLTSILPKLRDPVTKGFISMNYGSIDTGKLPVIYIDRVLASDESHLHQVTCKDYEGGYMMMKKVLERGHRNIVIFFHKALIKDRLRGFYDAMKEAGIMDFQERTFMSLEYSIFDAESALKRMLEKYPDFTAVATGSDDDIYRVICAAKKLNFNICGQVAMTGFGNVPGISGMLPIASVDQHPFRMGIVACNHLIDIIENGVPEKPIREYVDVEIVNENNIRVIPDHGLQDAMFRL